VLDPGAFARRTPLTQQTWMLSVFRERVVWQRSHVIGGEIIEFVASAWAVRLVARARGRGRRPQQL
jgi:hypothetical protein